MSGLRAITVPETTARRVLWEHVRRNIGACLCGWGVDSGELGRSHAEHVLERMRAEGLRIVALTTDDLRAASDIVAAGGTGLVERIAVALAERGER